MRDDRPDEKRAWQLEEGDVLIGTVVNGKRARYARGRTWTVTSPPVDAGMPKPARYVRAHVTGPDGNAQVLVPNRYLFVIEHDGQDGS